MFSRFAAPAFAAMILLSAAPARAFDASGYFGDTTIEILVTGDATSILHADDARKNTITLYAMSLAGRLNFIWRDRMTSEFGDRAFMKAMLVGQTLGMNTADENNLLKIGTLDANRFAAQYDYDSDEARNLLAALAALIVD